MASRKIQKYYNNAIFLTEKGKEIADCMFPIAMQTDAILRYRTDGSDQNFIDNILEELDNMLA